MKVEKLPPFRHELKYLINEGDYELLRERLGVLMQHDMHTQNGKYKIRSLYFDDYFHSAFEEKQMGVAGRKKYRIRFYNDSDQVIHLECKEKEGAYIRKRSASLSRFEVEQILSGQYFFLEQREENLCREFYYQCISRVLRPRVIVDYEREPFVIPEGDVRITFDRNVRSALMGIDLFDSNLPTLGVFEPGKLIMEVKYTEFLPNLVRRALPPRAAELTAASKFVLCCERTNYLTTQEYEFI